MPPCSCLCGYFAAFYLKQLQCCCCSQMNVLVSTKRMQDLERKFDYELVQRADRVRASKPPVELPPRSQFVDNTRVPSSAG